MPHIVSQAIAPDNEDYLRAVMEVQEALEQAVTARLPAGGSFAERERAVLTAANEACRRTLATALQTIADAHPDHVRVDGVPYDRHHVGTAEYHSLCGPLEVRRATYRERGERNTVASRSTPATAA